MTKQTKLYLGQSTLKGRITQTALSQEGFTASWTAEIFDAFTGVARTLDATGPIILTFDPQNKKQQGIEEAIPASWSVSAGTYTFTNTLRGVDLDAHDDAGAYANAKEWTVGTEFGITTSPQNQNYLKALLEGTLHYRNTMNFRADQNFLGILNFKYTPAYLTCGSSPTTTAATWAAVTNGNFAATINGTAREFTAIDFSNVGNNDQVAKVIQAAIRTVTSSTEEVEWDGTQFTIRSGDTASTSAITVLSAIAVPAGTDISGVGATAYLDGETARGTVVAKDKGFLISGTVADITERDALTGVTDGAEIFVTSTGVKYDRLGGAWAARAADTTANASTTVTGRVQLATSAQSIAGTDTDTDPLVVVPSDIAKNAQSGAFISATSAVGTDTYAITMTPTLTAYTDNMMVILDADVTNTGACTVNIDSLGVKSIKLPSGTDPNTSDIFVGPNILIYDGTNFVLVSVVANAGLSLSDDPHKYWYTTQNPLDNWDVGDVNLATRTFDGYIMSAQSNAALNDRVTSHRKVLDNYGLGTAVEFDSLTAGDKVIYESSIRISTTTSNDIRFGFGSAITHAYSDVSAQSTAKFFIDAGAGKVVWSDASGAVSTDTFTLTDATQGNLFRIEWIVGTSVTFIVNGATVHTKTTNIPLNTDTGIMYFYSGAISGGAGSGNYLQQIDPYIAISK